MAVGFEKAADELLAPFEAERENPAGDAWRTDAGDGDLSACIGTQNW